MNTQNYLLSVIACCMMASSLSATSMKIKHTNMITEDRMLLVLAAPSVDEQRFIGKSRYQEVVGFHIDYAQKVMGHDNVVIVVDKEAAPLYREKLPEDVLLVVEGGLHIWMRDFTTVNPLDPVQCVYTWASMSKRHSKTVQKNFSNFADKYNIQRKRSKLLMDGGNVVDNYAGKAVVTTRFLEDNDLDYSEGKEVLKSLLGASQVAIIKEEYGDCLGHSDGNVMWIEEDVLLVNDYKPYDKKYRKVLLAELKETFPKTRIVEVPVNYTKDESSAVGINVNSTVTFNNIYVPVYGMSHEEKFLDILKKNTDKKIHTIKSNGVAPMGGSVRCLTWQLTGENAKKLILTARKDKE